MAKTHKNNLFNKYNLIILIGLIILVCALIVHPWDQQWKKFILSYDDLQGKGTILRAFLATVVSFGKGACIAFFVLIFAAAGFRKKAKHIFISLLIMTILVWSLKIGVHRERPNNANNVSFPSGDTATASAFLAAAAVQVPALTPVILIAPAVGFCRTYSNWHYLSDVTAGLAFGLIAVGLSGYIRFRKLDILIKKTKPRIFAISTIILLFAVLLPAIIKGGGSFLDFFSFYGPASMIYLASRYSLLFVLKDTGKKNIFANLFRIKRNINNHISNFIDKYLVWLFINKITAILLIAISFTLLYFSWTTIYLQKLRLPTSGIAIAILAAVYIIGKQYSNLKNRRSALQTLVNSIFLILFFILILELPALYRNNQYYIEKKHTPQHSMINRIF